MIKPLFSHGSYLKPVCHTQSIKLSGINFSLKQMLVEPPYCMKKTGLPHLHQWLMMSHFPKLQ